MRNSKKYWFWNPGAKTIKFEAMFNCTLEPAAIKCLSGYGCQVTRVMPEKANCRLVKRFCFVFPGVNFIVLSAVWGPGRPTSAGKRDRFAIESYSIRLRSLRSRAIASRNVSTLAPGERSSPDLAWIAEAIRSASAPRVSSDMSRRREKNPSRTSRSAGESFATWAAGNEMELWGSSDGWGAEKICAVNVLVAESFRGGGSGSRSRTTRVPAARSPSL